MSETKLAHQPQSKSETSARYLDMAAGALLLVSFSVLIGWFTQNERLVQLTPKFVPMQFNTALGFAFCAMGLFAVNHEQRFMARVCAITLGSIGVLTLIQYAFDVDLLIDELFMKAYITTQTSHPGRMAPNTALCFALAAMIFAIASCRIRWNKSRVAEEAIAFTVLALAMVPFIGYIRGVETAYGWGNLTRMAPHTSAAFILFSMAIVVFVWRLKSTQKGAAPFWLLAGVSIGVLLLDLNTPLGIAIGVAYVPLVFCAIWLEQTRAPFMLAAFASGLIVLGLFAGDMSKADLHSVIVNRTLSIAVVWIAALLVYLHQREQKRSETSRTRLRIATQAAKIGVWEWNITTGSLVWDSQMQEIYGTTDTITYEKWKASVHKDDVEAMQQKLQTAIETAKPYYANFRVRRSDGEMRYISSHGLVEYDLDGAPMRVIGSNIDVTQIRQAEEQVATMGRQLSLILDHAGEGIYGVDLEGRTTFINAAALDLLGYTAEEMVGLNQHELVHHHYPDGTPYPKEECKVYQAFKNGVANTVETEVFWRKDGEPVQVEYTSTPIHADGGKITGAVVVFRDITERKQMEQEREQLLKKYIATNYDLENFARVASHDLQEPLRKLMVFGGMLKKDIGEDISEQANSDLDIIISSAERMQRLVKDSLRLARISGEVLELSEITPRNAINTALANLDQRSSDLKADIIIPELPPVFADPTLLAQIFQNLIGNSLKFVKADVQPRIEITVEESADEVILGVRDNGIGIDEANHNKIFQPLTRLHGSDKFEGTGIGLAVCKRAVERFGGKLWVESAPGEGAHFRFSLKKADSKIQAVAS